MGKNLAKILGFGALALAGCAYKTPGLIKDMEPGKVTERDTPYSVQELVYDGRRAFVRKIPETKEAKDLEDYLNITLIPVENSNEVIDISDREVRIEGDNYVLNSLGRRTIEILGKQGEFVDYFKPEKGLNERTNRDIPFRAPTIEIYGREFYKITAEKEECGKLPLYLVKKQGAEIILRRRKGKANRICVRGIVYQGTLTEIVDKPEPKPIEVRGRLINSESVKEGTKQKQKSQ